MFQFRLRTLITSLFGVMLLVGIALTIFIQSNMQKLDGQVAMSNEMVQRVDTQFKIMNSMVERYNVLLTAIAQNDLFRRSIHANDLEQRETLEMELTKLRLMDPNIVSLHLIQLYNEKGENVYQSGKSNHICFCDYEFFNLTKLNRPPLEQIQVENNRTIWSSVLTPYFYAPKPQVALQHQSNSDSFTLTQMVKPYGQETMQYALQVELRATALTSLLLKEKGLLDWVITDEQGNLILANSNADYRTIGTSASMEPGSINRGEQKVFYQSKRIEANHWKVTAFYEIVPVQAATLTRWMVLGIPLLILVITVLFLMAWLLRRLINVPFERIVIKQDVQSAPLLVHEFHQLQNCMVKHNQLESSYREQLANRGKEAMAIKDLFDYVGLGIVTFYADFIIHQDHSSEATYVYRTPFVSRDFVQVTFREDHAFIYQLFNEVFNQTKADQRTLYLSLLPTETTIAGHIYELTYKMITKDQLPACMVIFTDVTAARELAKKLDDESKTLKMVVKAVQFRNDVLQQIDTYRRFAMTEVIVRLESDMDLYDVFDILYRQVHTFKGTFAQYSFASVVSYLHQLEDQLNRLADDDFSKADLEALLEPSALLAGISSDEQVLRETLGDAFFYNAASTSIDESKIAALEDKMLQIVRRDQQVSVMEAFRSLREKPIRSMIEPYAVYVAELATDLEKEVAPLALEGGYFTVDPVRYERFSKSLVHVFRNMVDHGIETPDGRLEVGKPEKGTIRCTIQELDDEIELVIADDGQGINRNAVIAKAIKNGLLTDEQREEVTDAQIIEWIFHDEFSTREEVTKFSGRGVGMSAVRAEVLALGGQIEVNFEVGRGTSFQFKLPKRSKTASVMVESLLIEI